MEIRKRTEAFLNDFVGEYLKLPEEERVPLFRITEDVIVSEKLAGHVFEWATQYLSNHGCPALITHIVCAEVISRIEKEDVGPFQRLVMVEDENEEQVEKTFLGASPISKMTFATVDQVLRDWSNSGLPASLSNLETRVVSSFAIKNTRRKMEDRTLIVPDLSPFTNREDLQKAGVYAVFDGHGGSEAASYAASQLVFSLINTNPTTDLTETLSSALTSVDEDFLEKSTREHSQCGSTGVVSLLSKSKIHLAWLGDTQAMLVRSGRPMEVMSPHKPERIDEKERIEKAGGCVLFFGTWRVNGVLAVSRAIGDYSHRPHISGTPDTNTISLTGNDEYFVIACDGLWDTITPDKCTELVYKHVVRDSKHRQDVAEMLVKEAKAAGSSDNISVIIIFLSSNLEDPLVAQKDKHGININDEGNSSVGGADNPTDESIDSLSQTNQSASSSAEADQSLDNTAYDSELGTEVSIRDQPTIDLLETYKSDSFNLPEVCSNMKKNQLRLALKFHPTSNTKSDFNLTRNKIVKRISDTVLYRADKCRQSLHPKPPIFAKRDGRSKTSRHIKQNGGCLPRSVSLIDRVLPVENSTSTSSVSYLKRVNIPSRSQGEQSSHNSLFNASSGQLVSNKESNIGKSANLQLVRTELQIKRANDKSKRTKPLTVNYWNGQEYGLEQ